MLNFRNSRPTPSDGIPNRLVDFVHDDLKYLKISKSFFQNTPPATVFSTKVGETKFPFQRKHLTYWDKINNFYLESDEINMK